MNYIGEKVKELRRKNDMTQEKLADYLCVTYQTVSKWETGITSPDLSLIVPIARLFKVTTDELFDYSESLEDMKRSEFKKRYDETFKTGDMSERLSISGEAVKAYPGDMKWLDNYAWAVWCNAVSLLGDSEYGAEREKAIKLFQKVIENCESDDIKGIAIVGIVQCLVSKGSRDEAKRYVELYPDTKISASEKEKLLIDCLTGEEKLKKRQDRLYGEVINIIHYIMYGNIVSPKIRVAAEKIIEALIPDGNYLTFHLELYDIALSEARYEIKNGNIDSAMLAMKKARKHAIAFDEVKCKECTFTSPLFNRVKITPKEWCITGTTTTLEDFRALFDYTAYAPLKKHKDYIELIK